MAFVAHRGGSPIGQEELKAHLAHLLQLENVAVLLGAGASVGAGGRTVKGLWNDFVDSYAVSASHLKSWKFVTDDNVDPDPIKRVPPNIERLGDTLEIALSEWKRQEDPAVPPTPAITLLEKAVNDIKRCVVRASLLSTDGWTRPASTAQTTALDHHKSLLQKLTSARQPGQSAPWVFTTNYDLAVEWAAEAIDLQVLNGFMGLHQRRFSAHSFDLGLRNTMARGEARFGIYNIYLAKLHGSLTWTEQEGEIFEHAASACSETLNNFLAGTAPLPQTMVFPRAAKYMETIGFVLGELLRRFSEYLVRPQTSLLLSGYGFGDEHLNRILLSALQNPTLQVVVYLPEWKPTDPAANTPAVRTLMALKSPRVTIVGGMPEAFFDSFVGHLPDPIIYDENAAKIREMLRVAAANTAGSKAPGTMP